MNIISFTFTLGQAVCRVSDKAIYSLDNAANSETCGFGREDWERTDQEFREGRFSGLSLFALVQSPSFWQYCYHTKDYVRNKRISSNT